MEPIRKSSIYNTPEDVITCPYDKNHVLLWFRLERHIWKCHRADKEKQRALREVMMKEEEENWDHFNEPSYLDFLRSKKNHNVIKQRASCEVMMKEEEENWDHFNEPSYLVFLKSKKNDNVIKQRASCELPRLPKI
ncbi:hypothetical protein TcasGA2_TC031300 [Tribolium castaneum]|uniref:CHHC U11-48K-type domain-containing protein n=1 Tax=Tribolium castaneum TaxID=7070 RepID=A0A139WA53_TRICA|nr:hypothetical protein TcasGA2_TC031300 [Tribolium castaneum]